MDRDFLFQYIDDTWRKSTTADVAKHLASAILSLSAQEASCLTYKDLARLSGRQGLDETLHSAVTILTGGKHPILKAFGVFVDESGDEFQIRDKAFSLLLRENCLVHPHTGVVLEDAMRQVAPVFERISDGANLR